MKILLNISERLYAIALLNQFKGNLETLTDILEDIKRFRITDEEWTKADRQITSTTDAEGKPITNWTWNDAKEGNKEIEITKATKDYLTSKLKEANEKGEFTLRDLAAISLSEKLEKKK